jgi:hypothetical protein
MKKLLQNVKDWFERYTSTRDWEMEKYLAGASDAADLEYRMRKWDREMSHRSTFFMR